MSTINKTIPVSITKTIGGKIGVKECSSIVQGAVVWVGAKSFACTSLCCCVRSKKILYSIELMINKLHGLSPSGGLVSPSGGFASLLFDQVEYFASIKLCQALSRQGAIIKIPVVRCHYLLCSSAQFSNCLLRC